MKLSDLTPHPGNPRKITDKQLKMLEKSLKEFGDLSGVIFNKKTGHLIGGHQRLKIIPKDVEVTMTDKSHGYFELNGDKFGVRIVDWDETKEKAANIAANKGAGGWDFQLLSEWIIDLDHQNIDMDLTMFDSDELKSLFGQWDSGKDAVDKIEENLDGIVSMIKIKCPQEFYDEVLIYIKAKLLETSFTGVEVV
jgi:hypothetical protein